MSTFFAYAPITALLFFLSSYLWILLQTLRPSSKQALQPHAHIPLREENNGR